MSWTNDLNVEDGDQMLQLVRFQKYNIDKGHRSSQGHAKDQNRLFLLISSWERASNICKPWLHRISSQGMKNVSNK